MAAPNPLNTLHAKLDYDRDVRSAPQPPSLTLASVIGMLHTALTEMDDQVGALNLALALVAYSESEAMPTGAAHPADVPEAVAGVQQARERVEALTVRLSNLRNRLAL